MVVCMHVCVYYIKTSADWYGKHILNCLLVCTGKRIDNFLYIIKKVILNAQIILCPYVELYVYKSLLHFQSNYNFLYSKYSYYAM